MLRRPVLLVLPALLALCGCGPRQGDVERSIRDEMKTKLGVVISSLDLKKQGDGSYAGTATAQNGDVYEVTTQPPRGNKIEWKAIPGQAMVEKMVREGIEKQMSTKVLTLRLTKSGPGSYSGTADLATGAKVTVTTRVEGAQILWEAKPANP
jgi:hypothetical protein